MQRKIESRWHHTLTDLSAKSLTIRTQDKLRNQTRNMLLGLWVLNQRVQLTNQGAKWPSGPAAQCKKVKQSERELHGRGKAFVETAASLTLSKQARASSAYLPFG
jgi:hypothetical protein